jgi:hypothetical protein
MSRLARCALVAICMFGAACGGSGASVVRDEPAKAEVAPRPSDSPNPVSVTSASSPSVDQSATAEREVASALAYVSALRELAPLAAVKSRVISRDEMVAFVERDLDTEIPPAVVSASGEILFALGTVPASFDYRRGLLDVMRAELLGFYEPHEKTMFLGADLHGQELDATLWHELVHALQDQHYGLEKLLTFANDAGDWQSAVHALAEGDATSAMIDAMFAGKGGKAPDLPDAMMDLQGALSTGSVQQVPAIIKRSVVAPYVDGLSFVNSLRRRGGWAAVDAVWQRLPSSTEQLLHLEKYDANEIATVLPALAAPNSTLEQLTYSDIYGEETLRVLFEEWMPARVAHAAAAGWGGDRISTFSDGSRTAVAWIIRYDSDAAAGAGLRAFARGVLAPEDQAIDSRGRLTEFISASEAGRATRSGQLCRERHTRGPFAVLRRGRDVAVTLGPFRRNSGSTASDGDCAGALKWAAALARELKSIK